MGGEREREDPEIYGEERRELMSSVLFNESTEEGKTSPFSHNLPPRDCPQPPPTNLPLYKFTQLPFRPFSFFFTQPPLRIRGREREGERKRIRE